eukprot:CAMPEP_0194143632 /NCGR_PEP_ID=MMETSP0152-20130528/12759_1 /TAXON_ID=1049557 /ORGANISM="Thalassiothrix antarctica, Strain L6-D1" /LENGTH=187 /DNA_ID=CAMNT_0038843121 /DNA_START=28 /DNA_END=591 /DNA_ORIENTATION=+
MATLCIGGICIPYTAIIPLIMMGLKYLLNYLKFRKEEKISPEGEDCCDLGSCCSKKTTKAVYDASTNVQVIESEEEWKSSFFQKKETIVIKFTAVWCSPCKKISPLFGKMAEKYAAHFIEMDVDEFDEYAAKYDVKAMPTFCILSKNNTEGEEEMTLVDTLMGADELRLKKFCASNLYERMNDKKND